MSNVPTWFAAVIAVFGIVGTLSGPFTTRAVAERNRRHDHEQDVTRSVIAALAAFRDDAARVSSAARSLRVERILAARGLHVGDNVDRYVQDLARDLPNSEAMIAAALAAVEVIAPEQVTAALRTLAEEHEDYRDSLNVYLITAWHSDTEVNEPPEPQAYTDARHAVVLAVKESRETTRYPTKRKWFRKS